MSEITRDQVERVFRTFEAKDLGGMMACFAKDALLFDPHYPVKEMRGQGGHPPGADVGHWQHGAARFYLAPSVDRRRDSRGGIGHPSRPKGA